MMMMMMMMMMLSSKYGLLHAWIVTWCTNHRVIEANIYKLSVLNCSGSGFQGEIRWKCQLI